MRTNLNFRLLLRELFRYKFYSVSAIIGFGTALTIATIATAFYVYEANTDRFVDQSVYRILMSDPIQQKRQPLTYHELSEKLRTDFPEVSSFTHIYYKGYLTIAIDQQGTMAEYLEKSAIYCDTNFLDIFSLTLYSGDPKTCLASPNSVILTKEYANKYFGTTEVLDKTIQISNTLFKVTGVLNLPQDNSHLRLSILLSYSTLNPPTKAMHHGGFTYIKLRPGASSRDFESKLNTNRNSLFSYTTANWPADPFRLEHISEVYYYSDYESYLLETFRVRDKSVVTVYAFVALAIFIVACVNFSIFFYSKTVGNFKQYVLRKIFGAGRMSMFFNFVAQVLLILVIGFSFATILSILILPQFNQWTASSLPVFFIFDGQVLITMLCGILFASVLLGAIFAATFGKLSPALITRGSGSNSRSTTRILNGLMTIQLVFSVTLILFFLMVRDQIISLSEYSLGYTNENLVEIELSKFPEDYNPQTLKDEFLKNHLVKSASVCFGGPMTGRWSRSVTFNGSETDLGYYQVDSDFASTMEIQIIKGRDFEKYTSNDSSYLLFNETGAKFFQINDIDSIRSDLPIGGKIVGIIKDFHYSSLKEKVSPSFLQYVPYEKIGRFGAKMIVRLEAINQNSLATLRTIWSKHAGDKPFEFTLVKDDYLKLYNDKADEAKLLSIAVSGILVVTCFGILGVTSFASQRRMKEMAIRRVLGAEIGTIYSIWFKGLTTSILIAFIIAAPVSLYYIQEWASSYVYKTPLTYSVWVLAILITVAAVFISSFYYIRQASTKNASEVLKYE